jgi:hypothetical protein
MTTAAMQQKSSQGGSIPPPGVSLTGLRRTAAGSMGDSSQVAQGSLSQRTGSRGPLPPGAASPGRTISQQSESRGRFYYELPQQLTSKPLLPLRSPFDFEIGLLFLPALLAGILEPIQQTVESILVGKLGVSQASQRDVTLAGLLDHCHGFTGVAWSCWCWD